MSETNNLPARLNLSPHQITPETVKAKFNIELTRNNYEKVLQGLSSFQPDKNNLKEVHAKYKEAESLMKELEKSGVDMGSDYFKAHRTITSTVKEVLQPISTALASLKASIKKVDDEVAADLEKARQEEQRINKIKAQMTGFIANCTKSIPVLSSKGISLLQSRIGSEKSRSSFYQEFLEEFKIQCNELDPLINERKEALKKLEALKQQQEEAQQAGDVDRQVEISEQMETINDHLEINSVEIQETAFNQTLNNDVVVAEQMISTVGGRHYWRWEVTDIQLLQKKHPELVKLEPNKEAIDAFLAEKKKDKEFQKESTFSLPGLLFKKEKKI